MSNKVGDQLVMRLIQSSFGILSSVLGNIVIFILVARSIGPAEFGAFALAYATASIAGIVFDFGYMIRLLRDTHTLDGRLPARALWLKGLIFFALSACLMGIAFTTDLDATLLAVTWVGIALVSVANLFSTMIRAIDMHARDARNLLAANALGAILAFFGTLLNLTAIEFASLFCVIGGVYLALSLALWRRHFTITPEAPSAESLIAEIKTNTAYVLDAIAQRGFGFLDILILASVASPPAVGLYQAGQKVAQGASVFAQPFNNVLLPRLSKAAGKPEVFRPTAIKFAALQFTVACLVFALFAGFGPLVIRFIYTDDFAEIQNLMWAFGLLVGMRYVYAALAMTVTALGLQKLRTIVTLCGLGSFVPAGSVAGSFGGMDAFILTLASIVATMTIILMVIAIRHTRKGVS